MAATSFAVSDTRQLCSDLGFECLSRRPYIRSSSQLSVFDKAHELSHAIKFFVRSLGDSSEWRIKGGV
jgi:hypothetical protein